MSEQTVAEGRGSPFWPYSVGVCYASVCTSLDDAGATATLNLARPTGVGPWEVAPGPFADGSPNPTPCPDNPGTHRHLLFRC